MIQARIIITAFNCDADLYSCISSLAGQSRKDFEVVIVNNSVKPVQKLKIWESYPWLTILEYKKNTGFSGGSNRGALGAQSEWIITLNPDTQVYNDWFENLMQGAEQEPLCDMLSSTLLKTENPSIIDGVGDRVSIFGLAWRSGQGRKLETMTKKNRFVIAPCGAAAAYRRKVFEDNFGFDTTYFCYLEDVDLGLRLQSKGHKCLHVHDAYTLHAGAGTTGENSDFQLYYSHKNQVRLMFKLTPLAILFIQVPLFFAVQFYLLIRTKNSPNWNSKIRGLRDGLFSIPQVIFKLRPKAQRERSINVFKYFNLLSWSIKDLQEKSISLNYQDNS